MNLNAKTRWLSKEKIDVSIVRILQDKEFKRSLEKPQSIEDEIAEIFQEYSQQGWEIEQRSLGRSFGKNYAKKGKRYL